jgi:hypothetical protein
MTVVRLIGWRGGATAARVPGAFPSPFDTRAASALASRIRGASELQRDRKDARGRPSMGMGYAGVQLHATTNPELARDRAAMMDAYGSLQGRVGLYKLCITQCGSQLRAASWRCAASSLAYSSSPKTERTSMLPRGPRKTAMDLARARARRLATVSALCIATIHVAEKRCGHLAWRTRQLTSMHDARCCSRGARSSRELT